MSDDIKHAEAVIAEFEDSTLQFLNGYCNEYSNHPGAIHILEEVDTERAKKAIENSLTKEQLSHEIYQAKLDRDYENPLPNVCPIAKTELENRLKVR